MIVCSRRETAVRQMAFYRIGVGSAKREYLYGGQVCIIGRKSFSVWFLLRRAADCSRKGKRRGRIF